MKKEISIEQVMKMLNDSSTERKFSLEEAEKIRGFFYDLARLQVDAFLEIKAAERNQINLSQQPTDKNSFK